jgi:hypothetical protein
MTFKKIASGFAVFLLAHLVLYAFTGIAFWGIIIDPARSFAIILVHMISIISMIFVYLD